MCESVCITSASYNRFGIWKIQIIAYIEHYRMLLKKTEWAYLFSIDFVYAHSFFFVEKIIDSKW